VLLYEEPTLRKTFGAQYEEYCRNVRRWVPHLHPWSK
jgi:protein-S-isoprenylcysteine O-methyltransferase Ste14